MNIIAIDPSLSATGLVMPNGTSSVVKIGKPGNHNARLAYVRSWVEGLVSSPVDMVVMEGYAYSRQLGAGHMDAAEVRGVMRLAFCDAGVTVVDVDPTTVKMFATGKGNANKAAVLAEAIRRLGYAGSDDNEADALWLWRLAHTTLHVDVADNQHAITLPQTHMRALDNFRSALNRARSN